MIRALTKARRSRGLTRAVVFTGLAWLLLGMWAVAASETKDPEASDRKIVTRVEPEYPETLKRLYVGGVVRIEVVVNPNGAVQSTKLLGGNPILGQSAMKAVKQWRYAPTGSKEILAVKLEFDPHR